MYPCTNDLFWDIYSWKTAIYWKKWVTIKCTVQYIAVDHLPAAHTMYWREPLLTNGILTIKH